MRAIVMYYNVVVILLYQVVFVAAETTVEIELIETTTELVTVITDIPKSDVDLAMNLDYGIYTTEIFPYLNSQFERWQPVDRCLNDYTRCLVTQGVAHPVCAYNHPSLPENRIQGFVDFNSYCDLYFDNCIKHMRFWRIVDSGKCSVVPHNKATFFTVLVSRKFFNSLPLFLQKIVKSIRK